MTAKLIYIGTMLFLAVTFYLAMKRIMRRDNYINSLILAFLERGEMTKAELLDTMYEYGCNDFRLKKIIARHNATREAGISSSSC